VLCTFELYVNHLTTNIRVLCTFLIDLKAAELQNICRNTVEKQNHRCRAPEYLIPIIDITKEFKNVFLFKFNIILFQDFKIFFFEWLFL